MNLDYLKFAIDNLRHRKMRSWLTMIGIFIGIASLVALIGLGEGLSEAINQQFGFLGADFISITASGGFGPPGTGVVSPLSDKELNAARSVPGIDAAAGRIIEAGKLVYNKRVAFGYAASIPNGEGRDLMEDLMSLETVQGRLLRDGDKGVVLLGFAYSESDNPFGKPIKPGDTVALQDQDFKVIGIIEKKGNFQIDGAVFLNDNDLRDLVDRPDDEFDIIGARFTQGADVDKIKANIEKDLRKIRDVDEGEEDFSVDTPQSILESVNTVLLSIQIFVYIIASISLVVGGIGIMNTMYTAVVERTKEIGIMKSIGAKNNTIFYLFFIESGLLGAVGGAIGAVFGYLGATGLAFIGKLVLGSDLISASVSLNLFVGAILFSFVLGSIFGTLPAVQASKLNPVDALRYAK